MRAATIRQWVMLGTLLALWLFFAWREPAFLSARNLSLLSIELAVTATLAMGMLLVLIPGHIDLSAGSGVGLAGAVAAVLVSWHNVPAPLALLIAAAGAALVWILMGALVAIERIPAFIITLGGLLVFRGLQWLFIRNTTVPVVEGGGQNTYSMLTTAFLTPVAGLLVAAVSIIAIAVIRTRRREARLRLGLPAPDLERHLMGLFITAQVIVLIVIVANGYRGLPLALVIMIGVSLVVHVITAHTSFGRYLYAIGGNEAAAQVSGVPVRNVVMGAFALMGLVVALTGFMQTAYSGASTTTIGSLMELDAIAACVIGGTSLRGGRGSVAGVLFGALIMGSLLNGLTLMAVSPEVKYIARGMVLVLAVWLDLRIGQQGRVAT